jgi:hypothetical protein
MLRIERSVDGEEVRFTITGRIEAEHVVELQRLIDEEAGAHRAFVLDLKDVKLVAREAMSFFVRSQARGVRLDHCPAYVREWIRHESEHTGRRSTSRPRRPKTPRT